MNEMESMMAVEAKIEDILSCKEIPIVRLIPHEMNAFVMGYHVYKNNWTPSVGDEFQGFMESTNIMDKYAVAVKKDDGEVIGHLPLGKSGKFAKTIFYFLKTDKTHGCTITVTGKAINARDGLGMKVPCKLSFIAEKKFIDILQEKLAKLL